MRADFSDAEMVKFFQAHPALRARFVSRARAMENWQDGLEEADAAEELLVEEMRLLGRAALQGWAERRVAATEQEIRQQPHMHRQGEKNSAGIRNLAKSRSWSRNIGSRRGACDRS
jgi:hypothetical protein